MVLHEVKPGWTITKEWEGYTIQADIAFADIKPRNTSASSSAAAAPRVPSAKNQDLLAVTRYFFEHNLPIASVCHGVEIPARAGCVKGRRHGHRRQVPIRPRSLRRHSTSTNPASSDGNLVSGRTFHDNGIYLAPWIQLLKAEREKTPLLAIEARHASLHQRQCNSPSRSDDCR